LEHTLLNDPTRGRALQVRVTYPKDKGTHPILIWSHGAFGSKEAYGPLVEPGTYTVELVRVDGDEVTTLGGPRSFDVVPVPGTGAEAGDVAAFRQQTATLLRRITGADAEIKAVRDRLRHLDATIRSTPAALELLGDLDRCRRRGTLPFPGGGFPDTGGAAG